jgi:Na+/H+ antiporter NhaD/arsenite permease-like protein
MLMLSQILAIAIFLAMFFAIIAGPVHRFIPAIIGAVLTIVVVFLTTMQSPEAMVNVFNLGQLGQWHFWVPGEQHIESQGINWQTIIFIGGMMVMVEGMGQAGFFRWLCLVLAKIVNYQVIPILATFMLLSSFLAIATRRYAGIRRFLPRSTAQRVLQNSDKPVLLVRVPG